MRIKRIPYSRLKNGQEFLFQRVRYIKTNSLSYAVRISNGEVKDFGFIQGNVTPIRRR